MYRERELITNNTNNQYTSNVSHKHARTLFRGGATTADRNLISLN